jgi:uncharacterized protein (TIGR00299 family) protein
VAWFHCFSGVAGDMALGALIDAGAPLDEVRELCRRLPLPGWELDAEPVLRGGLAGIKVHVRAQPTTVVRTAAHIMGLVEEARLPDRIRDRTLATFDVLARAEGRLHRRPPSQVHFHEVGAVDSIIDIVGTCAALDLLGVDDVTASAVATGTGMVRSAHGLIPNPAPATVELLRDAPTYGIDAGIELATPTGAALLAAMVTSWGPLPALRLTGSGYGAGTADLDGRPNLLQVVIGEQAVRPEPGQPVTLLEVNVDDATGEVLAHAVAAVLAAGAHDAWITPIVGKKGRPAHIVSALCDPVAARSLGDLLARETGSLGVRGHTFERWTAARHLDEVEVEGRRVRIKVTGRRAKAEADDAARVAAQTGIPLREVLARAEATWRAEHPVAEVDGPAAGSAGAGLAGVAGSAEHVVFGPWIGTDADFAHLHPHGEHEHDHPHPHPRDDAPLPDDAG